MGCFIASPALSLTVWQGYLTRKHNRLSVRPRIMFFTDRTSGFSVRVINKGLGPAVIKNCSIYIDNKKHSDDLNPAALDEAMKRVGLGNVIYTGYAFSEEIWLESGEEMILIEKMQENLLFGELERSCIRIVRFCVRGFSDRKIRRNKIARLLD